ncbi:MAG: phospho-N-acetylmuramoyl-pentapeptide-transferase [Thermodesulfobacteriota bacterium]|nr:phospho-N-acetylmuramoyl-pentapeptide-transferase [Thermodesulfobacteriota bacterium]
MFYHLLYPLHTQVSFFNLFQYITFRTIYAGLTAFLICFLLGRPVIRLLAQKQVGQYIRKLGPESHQGKAGTPTMGGILIVMSILASCLLWANLSNRYVWIALLATVGYAGIGFVDDYLMQIRKRNRGLSGATKFLLQVVIALVVCMLIIAESGFNTSLVVPFFKHVTPDLGIYYLIFGVFIVVGASNAVNLTDGLDGLVAGPLVMSFVAYMVFAYVAGNVIFSDYLQIRHVAGSGEVTVFCGATAGALVGFLWFNAYPAQIFMGDVGSLPLGGALGTVAVITRQEIILALVGGIFVLETLSVIMQVVFFKATNGKRIFRMAPLHHHFELKGWEEPKIIVRFWIIALALALLAVSTLKIR